MGVCRLIRLVLLPALALLALAGCGNSGSSGSGTGAGAGGVEGGGRLYRVVATVGMAADLVRRVGGVRVEVQQLMGSGVDPHLYKPTRDDIRDLMSADLIVSVGLLLEGRMEETISRLSERQRVLVLGSSIPAGMLLIDEEGSGGHPDPHVWMDASLWSRSVPAIVAALSEGQPEYTEEFAARGDALLAELSALHEFGVACLQSVPEERRVLVTSHDAFRYFGRAYGVEVLGVQGISTESEAGLLRVNELVDLLVSRGVSAVFSETSVSQKNMQALIEGAGSRGWQVVLGGELFSDAMGESGTSAGTYAGMLEHNLTTVTRALGGRVPEGGFAAWQKAREAIRE
jgi:manganese/zinc/iron transport system substrate-binding protein